MLVDEGVDGCMQGADAAVHAALDLPFGQQGKKPLDLVSQDELVGVR